LIIFFVCIFSFDSYAGELENQYNELYSLLDIDELSELGEENLKDYYEFDITEPKSVWQVDGFDLIKQLIVKSISCDGSSFNIISVVLAFSVICMVTKSMVVEKYSVVTTFNIVSTLVCTLALLIPVASLVSSVCDAIKNCCVFMSAFIPIYAGLFVATGYSITSASYTTLMFTVTQVFTYLADGLFAPLCNTALIASVGSAFNVISKKYYELLKKAVVITLSSSMGLFITVLNLQTAISAPADSIGIKTVKTALGSFVPIIGSALSDSVSVLIAGAGTLKSTIGVYAVINIVVCVVPTLFNLLIWRVTVALSAAMLELSASEHAVNTIKCIGSVITLMISLILCVCVAYLLSVILTLSLGG